MARPSKFTAERVGRALEALRIGGTRRMAAERAGVDQGTFERWMKRYAGLAEDVKKAENDAEVGALGVIRQAMLGGVVLSRTTRTRTAADGSSQTVVEETYSRPDWIPAAWLLERRLPREFGKVERIELSVRERAQELADELSLPFEVVLAEAQRLAQANTGSPVRALPSGKRSA